MKLTKSGWIWGVRGTSAVPRFRCHREGSSKGALFAAYPRCWADLIRNSTSGSPGRGRGARRRAGRSTLQRPDLRGPFLTALSQVAVRAIGRCGILYRGRPCGSVEGAACASPPPPIDLDELGALQRCQARTARNQRRATPSRVASSLSEARNGRRIWLSQRTAGDGEQGA